MELGARIYTPKPFAGFEINARDNPLRSLRVNLSIKNRGSAARPFIEPKIVAVIGRIAKFPNGASGLAIEALDDLLIIEAMKKYQSPLCDHWSAETLANLFLPDD